MIFPFFNIATIEKKVGFVSNLDSEKSMLKGLSSSFKKKKMLSDLRWEDDGGMNYRCNC